MYDGNRLPKIAYLFVKVAAAKQPSHEWMWILELILVGDTNLASLTLVNIYIF